MGEKSPLSATYLAGAAAGPIRGDMENLPLTTWLTVLLAFLFLILTTRIILQRMGKSILFEHEALRGGPYELGGTSTPFLNRLWLRGAIRAHG